MHWIDYVSPHSVREAVELLAEHGESARILAGGTDLLILLRGDTMDHVNLVVDGKSIPELNEVTYDPKAGLTLGAAVPCYKIYNNHAVADAYPGLIDTASLIGAPQIPGRATPGGNPCNAAPTGHAPPACHAPCRAGICGPHGAPSHHKGRMSRAQPVGMPAGGLAGNPFGFSVPGGDFSVQCGRGLQGHVRTAGGT